MAREDTIYTYIPEATHKKVKGFAGLKGMDIPDAYALLVTEGLKALDFTLPKG